MCSGSSAREENRGRSRDRPLKQPPRKDQQPKPRRQMKVAQMSEGAVYPQAGKVARAQSRERWDSTTTLVNAHPGAVSTSSLGDGAICRPDFHRANKQTKTSMSQSLDPQVIASCVRRDAAETDRWHQPYNVFNQFSNRQEGTKFSKLGIGQLIMENKMRPGDIFNFTEYTGGHRCLICNRLIRGIPQSAALVSMSGPEARLPYNIHNIICRGDCFVRLKKTIQFT